MSIVRETIAAALLTKLQGAASFNLSSRRLQHWSDVDFANQPALFLVEAGESYGTLIRGIAAKSTMHFKVFVYATAGNDESVAPASLLNPIVDAIVNIMTPVPGTLETLGGLVYKARVSGEIKTDEGWLGAQAVAIIPIEVVTPN